MPTIRMISKPVYTEEAKVPSKAVIAATHGEGIILWSIGTEIECMLEAASFPDIRMLGAAPDGISIWEGEWEVLRYEGEYEYKALGTFRIPTDEEWDSIRRGECPFNFRTSCPHTADLGSSS